RLQQVGVPIGWTVERMKQGGFMPLLVTIPVPVPSLSQPGAAVATTFWLLMGGLLVGLGGPFWYQTVSSLTDIRRLAGGGRDGDRPAPSGTPAGAGQVPQPATPVAHFKTAMDARRVLASDIDDDPPVG